MKRQEKEEVYKLVRLHRIGQGQHARPQYFHLYIQLSQSSPGNFGGSYFGQSMQNKIFRPHQSS